MKNIFITLVVMITFVSCKKESTIVVPPLKINNITFNNKLYPFSQFYCMGYGDTTSGGYYDVFFGLLSSEYAVEDDGHDIISIIGMGNVLSIEIYSKSFPPESGKYPLSMSQKAGTLQEMYFLIGEGYDPDIDGTPVYTSSTAYVDVVLKDAVNNIYTINVYSANFKGRFTGKFKVLQ